MLRVPDVPVVPSPSPWGPAPAAPDPAASEPLAPGETGPCPVSFDGAPSAFTSLVVTGGFLQLLTFGFYRFWLKTDIRRHLWQHTRIGPDPFEYTGTARELLVGFLLALAILAPFYVLYFLAGIVAEETQAFASVPLVLVFYVFGQYAAFRARRYRLTRTTFRGLRFWMTGSAAGYAARAALWDLLTVATLGLALPWRIAALERYKMRRTGYGDLAGDFVASGTRLLLRAGWIWLIGIVCALGLAAAFGASMSETSGPGQPAAPPHVFVLVTLGFLGLFVLLVVLYPLYRAIELRWHLEGVRFGPVRAVSSLRRSAVFACYAKAAGAWFVLVCAAGATVAAAVGPVGLGSKAAPSLTGPKEIVAFAVTALVCLMVAIAVGVIKRIFVDRGLWAAIAGSTMVVDVAALDQVAAQGERAGSLGEGLADALDVGAI